MDLSTKPYRNVWFNRTHLPLFQNMSVKIYTNFSLSSGGYNFIFNYLKHKMKNRMWVHILLSNLTSSPLQQEYFTFGTGGQNAMTKQLTFILRYLGFKGSCDQKIKAIALILRRNVYFHYCPFFSSIAN